MRWLALIVLLAGCDRVFGLGDPYEDARSVTMGSDAPMPDGSDGSGSGSGSATLIASFPFDGTYDDVVSQTTAVCATGTGLGCTFVAGHSSGQSASFDGSVCLTFRFPAMPASVSIALWVKPTTGATETLLVRPFSAGDIWLLQEDNDSIYFQSQTTALTGTPGPAAGTWHAVAVTMGPDGSVAYLDGAVAGTAGAFMFTYTADTLYIGCNGSTGALGNFDGLIDDVEIYDGILDQTAVMQLAQ